MTPAIRVPAYLYLYFISTWTFIPVSVLYVVAVYRVILDLICCNSYTVVLKRGKRNSFWMVYSWTVKLNKSWTNRSQKKHIATTDFLFEVIQIIKRQSNLLVYSSLFWIMGVENLSPAHLTQVAMEIRTVIAIKTLSSCSIGAQRRERILWIPSSWRRG